MGTSIAFEGIMEADKALPFVADWARRFAEKAVALFRIRWNGNSPWGDNNRPQERI